MHLFMTIIAGAVLIGAISAIYLHRHAIEHNYGYLDRSTSLEYSDKLINLLNTKGDLSSILCILINSVLFLLVILVSNGMIYITETHNHIVSWILLYIIAIVGLVTNISVVIGSHNAKGYVRVSKDFKKDKKELIHILNKQILYHICGVVFWVITLAWI